MANKKSGKSVGKSQSEPIDDYEPVTIPGAAGNKQATMETKQTDDESGIEAMVPTSYDPLKSTQRSSVNANKNAQQTASQGKSPQLKQVSKQQQTETQQNQTTNKQNSIPSQSPDNQVHTINPPAPDNHPTPQPAKKKGCCALL